MAIHWPLLICSQSNNFQIEWKEKKITTTTKYRNRLRDITVQLLIGCGQSFPPWKLPSAAFLVLTFPDTDIVTEIVEKNKKGRVVNCPFSKWQGSLFLFPKVKLEFLLISLHASRAQLLFFIVILLSSGQETPQEEKLRGSSGLYWMLLSFPSVFLHLLPWILNRLLYVLFTDYAVVVCSILNLS